MRFFSAALVLLLSAPSSVATVVIEMKREAEVERNIVRLGDLARILCSGEEGSTAAEEVRDIYITLAPEPGRVKTVTLKTVRRRLRLSGVNLGRVVFEGPTSVRVYRRRSTSGCASPAEALESLIRSFVVAQLGRDPEEVRVRLEPTRSRLLARLARRGLRLAVTAPGGALRPGLNTLRIHAYRGVDSCGSLDVTVRVEVRSPVVVAARSIPRGGRVSAEDVRLENRWVARGDLLRLTPEEVVGRLAARSIRRGALVLPEVLTDLPIVRRGDMVEVVARAGRLTVRTTAVALEDGARGQTIRVRNPLNRKVYLGRVSGRRRVVVEPEGER